MRRSLSSVTMLSLCELVNPVSNWIKSKILPQTIKTVYGSVKLIDKIDVS